MDRLPDEKISNFSLIYDSLPLSNRMKNYQKTTIMEKVGKDRYWSQPHRQNYGRTGRAFRSSRFSPWWQGDSV
jgi:hypothetical protein